MARIVLQLEYEGTAYQGWQLQAGDRTVQYVVEQALAQICGHPVRLHGSGRTDAGVHARCLHAHFDTHRPRPLKAYREGVNALLPPDIVVRQVWQVPQTFHARFDARGKWYRYRLLLSSHRSPLLSRYSWQVAASLDVAAMRQAAALLEGRHDFAAFRSSSCVARTTEREIFSLILTEQAPELLIDVRGSGFLKNMVRILVGTLVDVGRGRLTPEQVGTILAGLNRQQAGRTAPPQGLCLMEVWYEKTALDGENS